MKINSSKYSRKGYFNKSKKREEFYYSLLNDISEDIEAKGRTHSREHLLELVGHLMRANQDQIDAMNELRHEVLMSVWLDSDKKKELRGK